MKKKEIVEFLKENHDKLTESQKKLGIYIVENYSEIGFLSALELGDRVGLSDATIIRFARILGFKGFSEFKNKLRENIKTMNTPDIRLLKNWEKLDKKESMLMNVTKSDLKNLEELLMNLDYKKIEKIVDCIYEAKKIYFCGLESSASVVDFLALHMRRMNFNVEVISEGGNLNIEKMAPMSKDDLYFVSSFPRYTKTTYQSLLLAKNKGAKVITLTDKEFNNIAMVSDISYTIKIENSTFFNSHVCTMELCNILLMSIFERDKKKVYENLKNHIKTMEIFDLTMD